MNRTEALDRIRSARVGRMATVTPQLRPHVVPFVFAVVDEGERAVIYWAVDQKQKRSPSLLRVRNIEANPAVELVVDGYEEEWSKLWWVRCSGSGSVVVSDDERSVALTALTYKYPQYADSPPTAAVIAIDVERLTWWES